MKGTKVKDCFILAEGHKNYADQVMVSQPAGTETFSHCFYHLIVLINLKHKVEILPHGFGNNYEAQDGTFTHCRYNMALLIKRKCYLELYPLPLPHSFVNKSQTPIGNVAHLFGFVGECSTQEVTGPLNGYHLHNDLKLME